MAQAIAAAHDQQSPIGVRYLRIVDMHRKGPSSYAHIWLSELGSRSPQVLAKGGHSAANSASKRSMVLESEGVCVLAWLTNRCCACICQVTLSSLRLKGTYTDMCSFLMPLILAAGTSRIHQVQSSKAADLGMNLACVDGALATLERHTATLRRVSCGTQTGGDLTPRILQR